MKYHVKRSPEGAWVIAEVWKRGQAMLCDSLLNKGTAFSREERELFGLGSMLPHQVTDRTRQLARAYQHIKAKGDDALEQYIGMAALQDRNETLFYQVLGANVEELLPVVYTPTVGRAAVEFSHIFRRGRGLWITPEHRGRIEQVLGHARNDDIRLIVATDNERILGLGDQGAGGMVIPIGKLALYTMAAGIHPAFTLPISLDVGTDNEKLLGDESYVGWPHPRLRGPEYESLIEEFVQAVKHRFPNALLQWEDFKKSNAFDVLDRYRTVIPSFNDDIQGTAAVVLGGLLAACRVTGTKLIDQRIVLVGGGAAGVGIAHLVRHALLEDGLSESDLHRVIAVLDSRGLIVDDRDGLGPYKSTVAWPAEVAARFGFEPGRPADLVQVVEGFKPTALIGTTAQPGLFTEEVVRAMAASVDRPIVFPLSNPTHKSEAVPADLVAWTDGRVVMATGSPFDPVPHGDRVIPVSQGNNVYIFPGVGLGTIVSKAREVTESMFSAAAIELARQAEEAGGGRLYPPIGDLRATTRLIGAVVAREACDAGVAEPMTDQEIEAALDAEVWDLSYPVLIPGRN